MGDAVVEETIASMPEDYTTLQTRCLCYGRPPSADPMEMHSVRKPMVMNDRTHSVWLAWLLYKNEEGPGERSFRDYYLLPLNWLTVQISGEDFIHCQLVFWDATRQCFYTYSVDSDRPVFVWHRKTFRAGWRFLKLSVSEAQELMIQNFLAAQLGKPLNHAGQLALYFGGIDGRGQSWFCSELVAAALMYGNVFSFEDWPGVTRACDIAPHHLFHFFTWPCADAGHNLMRCLEGHCPKNNTELLPGNPVQITQVFQRRRAAGRIKIQPGVLPRAIADFSVEEAAEKQQQQSSSSTGQRARSMLDLIAAGSKK